MIAWALIRLRGRTKLIAVGAILLADFILGPILVALEWRYFKPYLMP